jgi:hypothetical protein
MPAIQPTTPNTKPNTMATSFCPVSWTWMYPLAMTLPSQ